MKDHSGCETPLREKKPPGNCGKRVEEERGSPSSELKWKDDAYSLFTSPGEEGSQNIPEAGDAHQGETASRPQRAFLV